jgi:hypothetical protein
MNHETAPSDLYLSGLGEREGRKIIFDRTLAKKDVNERGRQAGSNNH